MTRHSLRFKCSVRDCPWPKDEEIHVPWCLGIPDVEHWADKPTHQHYPKKGMGGNNPKSRIVAILCVTCHDRIDNGTDWGNDVKDVPGRGLVYFAWDLHGNTLIERVLTKEESDGQKRLADSDDAHSVPVGAGARDRSSGTHSGSGGQSPLTHEQRVAIAQAIKDTEWNRQWIAGDVGNQWIAELGESAEQYLSDFGYVHESLANILRVCAAIPENMRRDGLRFSHHVVMLGLNREDMEMWLDKCEEEQWSVAEFRRQVKGTKPRVKRWNLEELKELKVQFYIEVMDKPSGIRMAVVERFLDWLGEQT